MSPPRRHQPGPERDAAVSLAVLLRELREQGFPSHPVLQRVVAGVLGVSTALVSAWESEATTAVPPAERLRVYARFFATDRSITPDGYRLLPACELTGEEDARRQRLEQQLLTLRTTALGHGPHRCAGEPVVIEVTQQMIRKVHVTMDGESADVVVEFLSRALALHRAATAGEPLSAEALQRFAEIDGDPITMLMIRLGHQ